jgi:hypothetical protein
MKSNCSTAIALPVKQGLSDGTNADMLVDARGAAIIRLFNIESGLTVEQASNSPLSARGMEAAACLVSAINGHDAMVRALQQVAATSKQQRLVRLANEALVAAGVIESGG